jgi:hypothetical protein
MRASILRSPLLAAAITLLLASTALASPSASAGGSARAVYNAIPSKVSGNVPSFGAEAYAWNEFGDEVGLGGTARTLQSMSVVLSSWGCESGHWYSGDCLTTPGATFPVDLTFTIYDNSGTPGAVLATHPQTVNVPYRPSASTICGDGRWYNSKDRTCYNGLPQTIKMTFSGVTLTDQVIWSVAYNTTHYGYSPFTETTACFQATVVTSGTYDPTAGGCGYDSLNVGAFSFPNAPYVGTDLDEALAFVCRTAGCSMEGDYTGYRPLGRIVAK